MDCSSNRTTRSPADSLESQQKNKDSFISMKPEDFQLCYICTMEDETGQILDNSKTLVCEGKPND